MDDMEPVPRLGSLIAITSVPLVTPGRLSDYDRLCVHWGRAIPLDVNAVDTATAYAEKM